MRGLHPYNIYLGNFNKKLLFTYARNSSGTKLSRFTQGADEKNLTTVKFFESWGVEKLNSKSGFIGFSGFLEERIFYKLDFLIFKKK